jgi:hypothetical protein
MRNRFSTMSSFYTTPTTKKKKRAVGSRVAGGPEPAAQTRDYRELPGGYGFGSSTLYRWIEQNMAKDAAAAAAAPAPDDFDADESETRASELLGFSTSTDARRWKRSEEPIDPHIVLRQTTERRP